MKGLSHPQSGRALIRLKLSKVEYGFGSQGLPARALAGTARKAVTNAETLSSAKAAAA